MGKEKNYDDILEATHVLPREERRSSPPLPAPAAEHIVSEARRGSHIVLEEDGGERTMNVLSPARTSREGTEKHKTTSARIRAIGLQHLAEFARLVDQEADPPVEEVRNAVDAVSRTYDIDPDWLLRCVGGVEMGPPAFCFRDDRGTLRLVTGCLGSGSFGVVYATVDVADPTRRSACKFIEMNGKDADFAGESSTAEIEALDQLGGLEGITAPKKGATEYCGIIMKYHQGPTLKELLKYHGGNLPVRLAVEIAYQATERLIEAQRLHLDIKPKNLMIDIDFVQGEPKVKVNIIDWGSSKKTADDRPSTMYSPVYAAPEQMIHLPTDKSDVYALATTLYELISGERAVDKKNVADTDQALERLKAEKTTTDPIAGRDGVLTKMNSPRGMDGQPIRDPAAIRNLPTELEVFLENDVPSDFRDGGSKVREAINAGLTTKSNDRASLERFRELLRVAKWQLWHDNKGKKEEPAPLVHQPRGTQESHEEYHRRIAEALLRHYEFAGYSLPRNINGGNRSPSGSRLTDKAAPQEGDATSHV